MLRPKRCPPHPRWPHLVGQLISSEFRMPLAVPLPFQTYVQVIRTERTAPRIEHAKTQEIAGKLRYGQGVALRLGSRALVLGQWIARDPEEQAYIDAMAERDEDGNRVLSEEDIDTLRARMTKHNMHKISTGWVPPIWHWRRYRKSVLTWLSRSHRFGGPWVSIDQFGDPHRPSGPLA